MASYITGVCARMSQLSLHKTPVPVILSKNFASNKKNNINNPSKPVRPKNSFVFFLMEEGYFKKENGKSSVSEAAITWKNLAESSKAKYIAMAKEDSERYLMEASNYVPSNDEQKEKKLRSLRKKLNKAQKILKELNGGDKVIQRKITPFNAYVQGVIQTGKVKSFKDLQKWSSLSRTEQEKYEKKAFEENEKRSKNIVSNNSPQSENEEKIIETLSEISKLKKEVKKLST